MPIFSATIADRLGALREPNFRLFFLGQAVSRLGDGVAPVALTFAVLGLTHSPSDVGFLFAARSVPLVGFLLIGGVFGDRLPRRRLMLTADLVRFLSQGLVAALLIGGRARLWELLALQAVHGAATAFFSPALTGLMPAIVSAGRLQEANSLRGLAASAGNIAGPALAGLVVVAFGAGWALAVDAASFGISVAFLARLRLAPHERLPPQSFLRDLLDGWREIRARTWLWVVLVVGSLDNFCAPAFLVLGAVVANRSLGGAGAWGLIVTAFGLGSFAGGAVALRLRPVRPLLTGSFAAAPLVLLFALLALRAPAVAVAAAALVAGTANSLFLAVWQTTLQQHVPARSLSRVSAYEAFGALGLTPVGYALVGPIASQIGIAATLWAAAAWFMASACVFVAVKSVRDLRSPTAS